MVYNGDRANRPNRFTSREENATIGRSDDCALECLSKVQPRMDKICRSTAGGATCAVKLKLR